VIQVDEIQHVYLACGTTDMRKSIDGLAALVQMRFDMDPFTNALFVFCGRHRDRLKILRWQRNGFWLYYRRLERGKFQWPKEPGTGTLRIGRRELNWLLDGLDIDHKKGHPEMHISIVG